MKLSRHTPANLWKMEKDLSKKKTPKNESDTPDQAATPAEETLQNSESPAAQPQIQTVAESADGAAEPAKPKDITKLKVEKSCSRGFGAWLASHSISLAVTSYQTGRLYLVGSDPNGRVSFFERIFERAMGVVGNRQRIYLGGL